MDFSRQFLLGVLALGLHAGLASALEPAPTPGNNTPTGPPLLPAASAAAPANSPAGSTAAAADLPTGIAPIVPTGLTTVPPQLGCTLDPHCPGCCGCCDNAAPSGIVAGAAIYWVQPYVSNNPAYGLENSIGRGPPTPSMLFPVTPPGMRVDQFVDIRQHMDVAPLFWLGYLTDSGWGGRVRYWYLREGSDQATAPFSPISGSAVAIASASPLGLSLPPSGNMSVTSELAMQFLDLEAMRQLQAGRWDLLFSGGLRFMRVDETYNAYGNANFGATGFFALLSNRSFEGIGPTLALEARRPFAGSGLALYGSARGSVVIGSANQQAAIPNESVASQDHQDRGVPIGELELGVEYERQVGHARLFGQIALVGQGWFGVGDASRSTIHNLPGGDVAGINRNTGMPPPGPSGYTVDGDIDLLGICFRIGVNY